MVSKAQIRPTRRLDPPTIGELVAPEGSPARARRGRAGLMQRFMLTVDFRKAHHTLMFEFLASVLTLVAEIKPNIVDILPNIDT